MNKQNRPYAITTAFGGKIITFCTVLLTVGLGCFALDSFLFKQECSRIEFYMEEDIN